MNTEITVLLFTAASIAFFHTLMGPDHYLPFIAIAKARGWSLKRTLTLTIICGVGHVVGSFVLGCDGARGHTGTPLPSWLLRFFRSYPIPAG